MKKWMTIFFTIILTSMTASAESTISAILRDFFGDSRAKEYKKEQVQFDFKCQDFFLKNKIQFHVLENDNMVRKIDQNDCKSLDEIQNRILSKVSQAIQLLEKLSQKPLGQSDYNLNLIKPNPLEFFQNHVKSIVIDSSPTEDGASAYVTSYRSPESKENEDILVLKNEFSRDSLLMATQTLVHEAHHFDGSEHVECSFDKPEILAGQKSCDQTLSEGGSYAVSAEFYSRIKNSPQHPHVSDSMRVEAKTMLDQTIHTRFNKPINPN